MTVPRQALIAAGGNLGDRAGTLQAAIARLRRTAGVEFVVPSSTYETEPVGIADQPRFLNLALGIATTLTPEALLDELQKIERDFGRVRTVHWGPRTLDLDLLAYENETRATASLSLPHPRMLERTFVTIPLRELLGHERFQGEVWDRLRAQLATVQVEDAGVRLYAKAAGKP